MTIRKFEPSAIVYRTNPVAKKLKVFRTASKTKRPNGLTSTNLYTYVYYLISIYVLNLKGD